LFERQALELTRGLGVQPSFPAEPVASATSAAVA
jgi:hypothetical protein